MYTSILVMTPKEASIQSLYYKNVDLVFLGPLLDPATLHIHTSALFTCTKL